MAEPSIAIRWARSADDLRAAIAVREQVFCREQGVPIAEELDGLDDEALHLIALQPEGLGAIGTLRLLLLGEEVKLGRVAVESDWRRRGVALRMIERALAKAREHGARRVRLASQLEATGLYERAGFAVESWQSFKSAGIDHVWMGLWLVREARDSDGSAAPTDEIRPARPS